MLQRAKYHVVLAERGGRELDELPWKSLNYGRVLDSMSSGGAVIPVGRAKSKASRRLSEIDAFEHELVIYRGDELAWLGVLRQPQWTPSATGLAANDLFQWFERRKLPVSRTFVETDLATVFATYAADAMAPDPSPGIVVQPRLTGILGDRAVLAAASRRAADELRELARNGVDFTVIGRTVLCGGEEVGAASLGKLTAHHFVVGDDTPSLTGNGEFLATETTVIGAGQPAEGSPLTAVAGGVNERLGLVQRVFTESAITDLSSLYHAAETRWEMLGRTPLFFTGELRVGSAPGLNELVPGAVATIAMQVGVKAIDQLFRLSSMHVTASNDERGMVERLGVEMIPVGTTE